MEVEPAAKRARLDSGDDSAGMATAAGVGGGAGGAGGPLAEGLVEKLIQQGAEGRVFESQLHGRRCVVKERFSKAYRHPELDAKIRRSRLLQEARVMFRCRKAGIDSPCLLFVDDRPEHCRLYMEFVEGCTVKSFLRSNPDADTASAVAKDIGKAISKIHSAGCVHGDLTTSNLMLREKTNQLVVIDFGLAAGTATVEERAVDLYVLERAFLSTHPKSGDVFAQVLDAYAAASKGSKATMKKLEEVRARGRKKLAFG